MTDTSAPTPWHRSFLLKDIFDQGLEAVTNKRTVCMTRPATSLSDILPAILAADNLYAEDTGAPNFELHIWLALASMLIGAGDALFSGVLASVGGHGMAPHAETLTQWDFQLNFAGTESVWLESMADSHKRMLGEGGVMDTSVHHGRFLSLTRITDSGDTTLDELRATLAPRAPGFAWRAMGEIVDRDLAVKMVTYPASVHPQLKDRTIANIPLYVAAKLGDAGVMVREHWFPEDTSKSFARYLLSDGIEHFFMDFHGGHLAVLLAHLDQYIGRDADMGGIFLDVSHPSVVALETTGDVLDSLTIGG